MLPLIQLASQQLVNGLTIGSVYALIALGYTMVYGVLQLINFAHGDLFMLGAMVAVFLLSAMAFTSPLPLGLVLMILVVVFLGSMSFSAALGVEIDRVIAMVFVIGPALGAAAGVLVAMLYGVVVWNMGFLAGIKAFTAAVLGGIGNIPGAMLGGLGLGLVETFGAGYLPILTGG